MAPHLVMQIEQLEAELAAAQARDKRGHRVHDAEALPIAARILELKEQAAGLEVEFVFRSIGRKDYTDLVRAHPATAEQEAEVDARLAWNTDSFPPALLARAVVAPTGTDEAWWKRKYDEWGTGQVTRVWNACLAAQGGVVEVPKATAASDLMSGSEPS